MFSCDGEEVEIKLGTLADAPSSYVPTYELWIRRREPWLLPIDVAEQHWEDRHPQASKSPALGSQGILPF
jgi:hypothetical protein